MIQFLSDRQIYEKVIREEILKTKHILWLATADLKDMHVEDAKSGQMVPFLKVLSDLLKQGVDIRLIHAKEPGPAFRRDFDKYPGLWAGLERIVCPRVHFKCIIIDCKIAYFGSANATGAGMGAKSSRRHNFENGVLTDDASLLNPLMEQFDAVWRGAQCLKCGRKQFCIDGPLDD